MEIPVHYNSSLNKSCCLNILPVCSCNSSNMTREDLEHQGSQPVDMGPPLYMYIYVTVINAIVFLVGIIGNILVIQVVARTRSMRKRMNYFLVSLSVADLLVLVVCLPIALLEFYGKERWYIGEAMCKIVPFLENASHHCSVLTLLAIGFERYYAICHPLRETVGARITSTTIVIPTVWVVSCVVSLPFAIISNIKVERYYDDSLVEICRTDMSSKLARAYIIFIFTVFLALPLLLLTVMYVAIIHTLAASTKCAIEYKGSSTTICLGRYSSNQDSDHVRNARAMSSRRQVVRMMVAVMSLYFLCLLPIRCVMLWLVFGPEKDLVNLGFEGFLNLINSARILITVNSAGNPIIYGLLSSNFRAAFRQSFFNCRSGQRDRWKYNNTYYSNNHHHHYLLQQSQGSPCLGNNHALNSLKSSPRGSMALTPKGSDANGETEFLNRYSPSPSECRSLRANSACSDNPSIRSTLFVSDDACSGPRLEVTTKALNQNGQKPAYV